MRNALLLGSALLLPFVAHAGFRASSHKVKGKSTEFEAASAVDDNSATAWQIDPESEQLGEWIEIDVPKSEIDKLTVQIGWEADEESWQDYGRLKSARVEIFSTADDTEKRVSEKTITFEDKRGLQTIDLDDVKVGGPFGGGRVRLTVTEIYAGDDYPSLALGEVRVVLKEQEGETMFMMGGEPNAGEGSSADKLIDGNDRTVFVGAEGELPSFTIGVLNYSVGSLHITPGPKPYARPKTLKISCGYQDRMLTVQDNGKPQQFMLPSTLGYTGSACEEVKVQVTETYEGTKPGVAIADIAVKGVIFSEL